MTVDLHNMQDASAVDLVQALIDELGVLLEHLPQSAELLALRCMSIASAVQEKVGSPLDQAKRRA